MINIHQRFRANNDNIHYYLESVHRLDEIELIFPFFLESL